MKSVQKEKVYKAPPELVFDALDDLGIAGMHMQQSSMPMMGSKMELAFLTEYKKGQGTIYNWRGKMLWWNLDFTVEVKKWIRGQEKVWETVGPTKLIIYSRFQMQLKLGKQGDHTVVILSINFEKPKGFLNRIIFYLLGTWYGRWCLNNMLNDAEKHLRSTDTHSLTVSA